MLFVVMSSVFVGLTIYGIVQYVLLMHIEQRVMLMDKSKDKLGLLIAIEASQGGLRLRVRRELRIGLIFITIAYFLPPNVIYGLLCTFLLYENSRFGLRAFIATVNTFIKTRKIHKSI